ncbi:ATP-binding protein [Streptomyces zhihengii]
MLTGLCEAHPLDESLHALRIRALRDTGRAAQALAAYEEVRRDLADRLGTDPGPELTALHTALLRPRRVAPGAGTGAGAGPGPSVPGAPAPGAGVGFGPSVPGAAPAHAPDAGHSAPASPHASGATPAHAPGAGHSASAGAPPAPGSGRPVGAPAPGAPHSDAPAPRGNLRARLTSFVGREPEVRALTGDLEAARLVTLLGPGGAGKTRLSQEAGEALAGRWPDGVWLAELAPVDDPATVPEAVLTAVGGRETVLRAGGAEELRAADRHGDDATTRLTEHCARRRMLLLLDNCEHVVDAAAALAQRLLEECPGLTVLATSREPLGVPGELLRPVDPLPDPMAVRLFAERGASARPGFRADADEETASAVAEICRRLDGMPLAIELAAARLRMLTPRQIADRLDDRFRLLTTGSRTVLPRQQTLRAVVDWSWDLLADDERAVLRRLSVFAGGCDLEAAESVCAATAATAAAAETAVSAGSAGAPAPSTGLRAADVAEAVGALVDKSLVVAEPADDGRMRYRLLETVAEYAGERLDEAGERGGAEWRHLVHYRELARTTDPELRGHGQQAALGTLRREYENLRAAVRRAVARGAEQEALCLVISLSWYWQMRDLRSDARQWTGMVATLHEDPFASPPRPAPPLTARCTDEPPPFAPEMLAEARRQVALIRMVSMDYGAEDWTAPDRTKWLESVVGVYDPGLPQACRFPASLWFYAVLLTGDGARVGDILDESVRTAEAAGHPWDLAVTLQQRANLLANRAQWAGDALRDADRSLEIFERLGDAWGIAEALSSRAEAHERRGEFERAAADCRAAITHARRVGVGGQVDLLRARLANTLAESGHTGEAEAILRDVVTGGGEAAHEALPAARLFLAVLLGRTGRTGESREQLRLLSEDLNGETLVLFQAMVTGMVAWLDLREGLVAEALAGARAALVTAMEPLSMTIAPQLPAMHVLTAAGALIALDTDAARRGARLVGAHAGLLPPGHVATVTERDDLRRVEDAARARLGDDFAALYEEGAALTLEEAAALVRAPQGPATD